MNVHTPFSTNPLHIANEAQKMAQRAEGADGRIFQKVAMVSMGVVALASVAQVFVSLLRELNRKLGKETHAGRGR
jgi:hypothetical protein